jgi:hypothetical protein
MVSGNTIKHIKYSIDGKIKTASSLVLNAFVGPKPKYMEVRFKDENHFNVDLSNLCYDNKTRLRIEARHFELEPQDPAAAPQEKGTRSKTILVTSPSGQQQSFPSVKAVCEALNIYRRKFYNVLESKTDFYKWKFEYA